MGSYINKILIIIYCKVFHIFNGFKHISNEYSTGRKRVLLVYNGLIGDAVLFIRYLKYIPFAYPTDHYIVSILTRKNVRELWISYGCVPKNVEFENVYIDGTDRSISNYIRITNFFQNKKYDILEVLPITNKSIDRVIYNIDAGWKIACGHNRVKPIFKVWYDRFLAPKNVYDEIEFDELDTKEIARYRNFFIRRGVDADLLWPKLTNVEACDRFDHAYCVFSIGASNYDKEWPINNFLKVIEYVITRYSICIVLCGDKNDARLKDKFEIINNPNVVDKIGKTSIDEWVSIITNAEFYVGNDSGGAHVAAGVGTPSVVINGKYQYRRFYPYLEGNNKNSEQIIVHSEGYNDCSRCREINGKRGYGNADCMEAHRKKKPYLCVSSVKVDEVIKAIDKLMKNNDNAQIAVSK